MLCAYFLRDKELNTNHINDNKRMDKKEMLRQATEKVYPAQILAYRCFANRIRVYMKNVTITLDL